MEDIRQNLIDAGCDAALTEQFLSLTGQGRENEALTLLARHRKNLLEYCHTAEKKIDCLDYLVYQMEKNVKERQGGISLSWIASSITT